MKFLIFFGILCVTTTLAHIFDMPQRDCSSKPCPPGYLCGDNKCYPLSNTDGVHGCVFDKRCPEGYCLKDDQCVAQQHHDAHKALFGYCKYSAECPPGLYCYMNTCTKG
uniref:Uncharacterized protein n=1 Tax=Panagrolaimus sp. ES5 TaxID=591445 RepID=A0AC34FTN7_9BILA